MLRKPLRANLLKEAEERVVDGDRALRTIKILGAMNLLLVIALGGSVWWGSRAADAVRINALGQEDDQPVQVFMEARFTSSGHAKRNGDSVADPLLTVYGIVPDFGRLREGLPNLAVTVRGTKVDIIPETGEFTERVVLKPGSNQIDIGLWWDGREQQRSHAEFTYEKDQLTAPTSTGLQAPL